MASWFRKKIPNGYISKDITTVVVWIWHDISNRKCKGFDYTQSQPQSIGGLVAPKNTQNIKQITDMKFDIAVYVIEATSHQHYGVWIHWQLDCSFNIFQGINQEIIGSSHY